MPINYVLTIHSGTEINVLIDSRGTIFDITLFLGGYKIRKNAPLKIHSVAVSVLCATQKLNLML